MAIEKSVSNYFWSTFVDYIDVFYCHQSGVNSLYASWCYGGHFCIQLNKIIWNRKVYNNDDITFFFRILTFAKPSFDNVLQPSPLRGSVCNTLSHSGLANVNIRKRMFYPLITNPGLYIKSTHALKERKSRTTEIGHEKGKNCNFKHSTFQKSITTPLRNSFLIYLM